MPQVCEPGSAAWRARSEYAFAAAVDAIGACREAAVLTGEGAARDASRVQQLPRGLDGRKRLEWLIAQQ